MFIDILQMVANMIGDRAMCWLDQIVAHSQMHYILMFLFDAEMVLLFDFIIRLKSMRHDLDT